MQKDDKPVNLHNFLVYALVGMAFASAALILDQIWLQMLPWDIFIKAEVSIVILALLDGFFILLRADLAQNKKLKDENYLD
ncbi:MAG: hypothetical protein H6862_06285 [Rhodospirillales bacterium]|nr:hypothetical protein [Rhodospirillales bacterium]